MSTFEKASPSRLSFRRMETFGDAVADLYGPVAFQTSIGLHFKGAIEAQHTDRLLLTHVAASPHEIHHQAALADQETVAGKIKLFVPIRGMAVINQSGQEALLEPGSLGLVDTGRDYSIVSESGFDFLILKSTFQSLGLASGDVAQLASSPLESKGGLDGVVLPYLTGLSQNLAVVAGAQGSRIARSTLDLVSMALSAHLRPQLSKTESARVDVFEQANAFIRDHLDDRVLTPGSIATALHVSPRHLHAVFADRGATIAGAVRQERLDAATADLLDPRKAQLSIAEIATARGFADGAHFTRTFRAAHGTTPSSYRTRER